MSNSYFQFKQFRIQQERCAMKVTTDSCLFGAWIAAHPDERKELKVLDIGSGTGLLTLMFSQKNQSAETDAVEIDRNAFQQGLENFAASPWARRVKNILCDIRKYYPGKYYDLIISNPPFYENELLSREHKKNIAHHGSELSLEELLTVIGNNLKKDGSFFLLLPYKRNAETGILLSDHGFFARETIFVRQTIHHDYFRILLQGEFKTERMEETITGELSIRDEHDHYTVEFINLLKDFYLYLPST